ncbi:MAG: phosphodiesterase [Clostridia bacterium]|nr:phosphodiesterase [Clostridia bacterium]
MKWMIAADLHGAAACCENLLKAFDREGAGRLILLGDLLYHGPRNDLPADYDPKRVIALLNPRRRQLLCVRGNCDAEVDQMVLDFPILAEYALLPVGERLIFMTHGHRYNQTNLPPMNAGDVLLHGHTHVPAWEPVGDVLYCNPGSAALPKAGSERSYMTLEDGVLQWKTLDGTAFHSLTL